MAALFHVSVTAALGLSCCLRRALNKALALVALAGDTVDGVHALALVILAYHIQNIPIRVGKRTSAYSLVASCHSLVIVLGGGFAKRWMT